ncbi:unnamed protein product, partial [marine sediment metagenome]
MRDMGSSSSLKSLILLCLKIIKSIKTRINMT